ncbi:MULTISPECIES: antitoxin Xre/MbcA/ParS toxin-binding domain-containing protein [unclassified Pseudomonas]|uniref:antitoxin Xre/MbcA/ParS toxin-binding domain-containing protein n=1 Tax=unclassified Pseudomonas TaxID=196821 RepID=UPI0039065AE3
MDDLSEKYLAEKYRKLFSEIDMTQMNFGFECRGGWVSLVDGVLRLVDRYGTEQQLSVTVEQVKEKFGMLRIYCRGGDIVVDRMLDVAELVSSCMCELCGATGRLYELNGWLQVRCVKHQLLEAQEVVICRPDRIYAESFAKAVSKILWFFKDKYASWLGQECLALGKVRPMEALTTIEGCQAVVKILSQFEHGVTV